MDISDNYLEVNQQNDRVFESLFRQMISTDKWSKPEAQQDIEETKMVAFCLKTKDLNTKQKLFINFCHSSMMKSPTLDLNEEELRSLLASEDSTALTIPLLITPIRNTEDKSGSKALVCDVIINSDFYINKISCSQLYKTFLITVTIETIEKDKYKGLIDKNDWVVLQNKKYHSVISNDNNDHKIGVNELSALLNINNINDDYNDGYDYEFKARTYNNGPKTNPMVSHVSQQEIQTNRLEEGVCSDQTHGQSSARTPKYKLKLDVLNNSLSVEVMLNNVYDLNQLDLRIGEDRIVLEALNYKLDIFVAVLIRSDEVVAEFDTLTSVLDLKMPLN